MSYGQAPADAPSALDSKYQLPPLSADLHMIIYVHHSINTTEHTQYGSRERLAAIGKDAVSFALTFYLFEPRPASRLELSDINSKRDEVMSDANIQKYVTATGLRPKLLRDPSMNTETIEGPEESRTFLNAYFGGVFVRSGLQPIVDWWARVIDNQTPAPRIPGTSNPAIPYSASSHTLGSSQLGVSPSYGQPYAYMQSPSAAAPPPPSAAPPPLPDGSLASPTAPATALGGVGLFNQMAAQKGLAVQYTAESTGPPHAPRWTVKCQVQNVEKGVGIGRNQKLAKEEAASKAMIAMGWA